MAHVVHEKDEQQADEVHGKTFPAFLSSSCKMDPTA
jgi:hypothetical protein